MVIIKHLKYYNRLVHEFLKSKGTPFLKIDKLTLSLLMKILVNCLKQHPFMKERMRVAAGFTRLISCLFMGMGASEIIFRFWYGKRGQPQNTRFLGPAIAFAAGLSGIFMLLLWEGGTRWFYFYQEGYRLLFHI
ncbi:MAG: hypothetical protein ABFS43_07425 [Thermodesulfobacteriota bacterium]